VLEGQGVRAEHTVPLSTADFYTNDGEQKRRISAFLSGRTHLYRSSIAWADADVAARRDVREGDQVVFPAHITGTDAVAYGPIAASPIGQIATSAPDDGADVDLAVPVVRDASGIGAYEFSGLRRGTRVWRSTRSYRIVPADTALADGERIALEFDSADVAPLQLYTTGVAAAEGWNVQDGVLKTGSGATYLDGTTAEASLFLDLTKRTAASLGFTADIQTEEGYDFFSVEVFDRDAGTQQTLLAPVSGALGSQAYSYDLAAFAGKHVEVRFTFRSDQGVVDRGVALDHLVVE
jgi:hypothetical protein